MGLESATYINGLVETNPTSSDNANQGDNHLRLIKAAVKATFPNITGPVTATQSALNTAYLPLAGGTATGPITAPGFVGNASTATALQTARTINGVSFNGTANISFNSDAVAEGSTNQFFTTARARSAISAAGDLSYNPTTGVISFSATGAPVISVAGKTGSVTLNTADVAEGSNLYFTDARARTAISVSGAGSYNSTTGVITINAGAVSSVAGKTGAVTLAIADTSGLQAALDGKLSTGATTTSIGEGTNLYFTNARARTAISVSGAGSYSSTTGVITINAAPVTSVAGKTGVVTLAIADTSGLQAALDGKFSTGGGTISGNVSVSGTVTATGDITAFSDERTKTNVETITEALYKVKAMRGVSYISKFNMEERIGVIAQEVERVVPEVVHTHENGLKSVAYQNLVGLLIEAIKALELRVAELESR
jgi:DNA uptake protein ComE-like DNA-binding protein